MSALNEKVQNALDEGRILVLGTQVLLGFEYRSFFEPRFEGLPGGAKLLKLATVCVMLLGFALIVLPAAYHRVAARGEDREEVHAFASTVLGYALLPLALALGLDVAFALQRVLGPRAAAVMGVATIAAALCGWYGFTSIARARRPRPRPRQEANMEPTKIEEKIRHVLTETRMVLPGAQALLGFQLAVTLTEPFDALPRSLQLVHVAALGFVAIVVVLLVTPAAYHRIVERGEASEHFHRVASRLLLSAMAVLALGLCADLYVVFGKVLESHAAAGLAALTALAVLLGLWFGLTLALRSRREARRERAQRPARLRST